MANNFTNQVQKTLGEQMADLLQRKPKNFDVLFSVGPDKIKVKAVKFVLKAASPVFETEFEEKWENGVVTDRNGIPLPDVDPTAFQLFVNLLILDAWSLDSIKSLKLTPNNLLNVLGLCRRYEITKAIKNLEEAADAFMQSFDLYSDTDAFLKISRENLETILSFEKLPLDETEIFECASRWTSHQCTIKGLEPTGENYREVLGGCFFQIRFPTMSNEEFAKVCKFKKNVLKGDEQLAIFLFIASDVDEKKSYNKTQIPFNTNRKASSRSSSLGCSALSMPPQFKLTSSPSFVCDGSKRCRGFKVNEKISLLGFGFVGPIDGDTNFEVTVQIKRAVKFSYTFENGTFRKNIIAPRGKIFHFLLEEPIVVESNAAYASCGNTYFIYFSLKGTNKVAQYQGDNLMYESFRVSGVQFHLGSEWNNENPLAELLFKKI